MEYIEPMDFKKIFVDYFLGSAELFSFALILIVSFVCAKYQMSNRLYMIILALSSLMFAFILGNALYFLILIIIGYISFKSIAKAFV